MQIGELAATTGTTIRVLRHYEKQGLILARRRQNGYRDYPTIMVERVNYIRLFLSCGFSTRQIGKFLPCYIDRNSFDRETCPLGYEQHVEKLREIDELIAVLAGRRERLRHAISQFGAVELDNLDLSPTPPNRC
jgi:MerR family transcriptional regulator, copper efflux regulator